MRNRNVITPPVRRLKVISVIVAVVLLIAGGTCVLYMHHQDNEASAAGFYVRGTTPIPYPYSAGWMNLSVGKGNVWGAGAVDVCKNGAEDFWIFNNKSRNPNVYLQFNNAAHYGIKNYHVRIFFWCTDSQWYQVSQQQCSMWTSDSAGAKNLYAEIHFIDSTTGQEVPFTGIFSLNMLTTAVRVNINHAKNFWVNSNNLVTSVGNDLTGTASSLGPSDERGCAWVSFSSNPSSPLVYRMSGNGKFGTAIYGGGYGITYRASSTSPYRPNETLAGAQTAAYGTFVPDSQATVAPVKGYKLDGWYSNDACTNKMTQINMVTSAMTVYGKYITLYAIEYDMNQGQGTVPAPSEISPYLEGRYEAGTHVELAANGTDQCSVSRDGYAFAGWSDELLPDGDTTSQIYSNRERIISSIDMVSADKTVYAVWEKTPKITFKDSLTGEVISQATIPLDAILDETDIPDAPEHPGYVFRGFSLPTTEPFSADTDIELLYEPLSKIRVNVEWIDRDNVMSVRPDIDLVIPNTTNSENTVSIHIGKDENTVEILYDPQSFTPPDTFSLPDLSPYEIWFRDHSLKDEDRIQVMTYNIRANYIPVKDVQITKAWNDMDNVYKDRPRSITVDVYEYNPNIPADTEEELDESMYWMLYDTVEITAVSSGTGNNHPSDSNTWSYTLKDVPIWTAIGHDGEELIDVEYKIVERGVYGYDSTATNGSLEEGQFHLENTIWKHIDMPETGTSSTATLTIMGTVIVLCGCICLMHVQLRRRK